MDLREKINLILRDEERQYQSRQSRGMPMAGILGSFNVGSWVPSGLLASVSTPNFVASPNLDRLLKLHAMLNGGEQSQFAASLTAHIVIAPSVAYLPFLTLHRLGRTVEAIGLCRPMVKHRPQTGWGNVLAALSAVVATEYGSCSVEWCEKVRAAIGPDMNSSPILAARLDAVLLQHLDAELMDANPEIYADRDRVLSIWEKNFGDKKMSNLVHEIDQYFRDGERSETAFASCVGRIRVLLETVCRAVADRCAENGKRPISPSADEHALFQHLEGIGLITKPEWNILRSLYTQASIVGSHALDAQIEDARLVKNMAYEMSLLLLTRMLSVQAGA